MYFCFNQISVRPRFTKYHFTLMSMHTRLRCARNWPYNANTFSDVCRGVTAAKHNMHYMHTFVRRTTPLWSYSSGFARTNEILKLYLGYKEKKEEI